MSLVIEVRSPEVKTRAVKGFTFNEQAAFVSGLFDRDGDPIANPVKVLLPLGDSPTPFPVGKYTLAPQSFFVGDYSKLTLARQLRLVPLK